MYSPSRDGRLHHRAKDLLGKKFAFLTILRFSHSKDGKTHWHARCDCGTRLVVQGAGLSRKRGPSPKSCGCQTRRLISEDRTTHGMSKHPAFAVWRSMLGRCQLPTHQAYRNYGGRGITVCKRWRDSFENFWNDMRPTYQPGLTLDRRRNDRNYTPGNCRWVSCEEQANNRRGQVLIWTPQGRMSVSRAARKHGLNRSTVHERIRRGWKGKKLLRPVCTTSST